MVTPELPSIAKGRCHASLTIVDQGQEIVFMYRVKPDDADSGWHFFADGEIEQFIEEPEYTVVCDLQTISERDAAVAPLLSTPWPVAFGRHALTGKFINCKDIRAKANDVAAAIAIGALVACLLYGVISGLAGWPPYRWFAAAQVHVFGNQSTVVTWVATMLAMLLIFIAGFFLIWVPIRVVTGRQGYAWPGYVCDMSELTLDAQELAGNRQHRYVSDQVILAATAASVSLVSGLVVGSYGLLNFDHVEKSSDAWFYIVLGATGVIVGLGIGIYAWIRYRSEVAREKQRQRGCWGK